MLDLTFEQLNNAKFELYEGNPVIRRFGVSPMIADPSVLTPDLTPDGKWRLYAHALWGVYEYLSDDGITFERGRKIVPRAMRPDMKKVGDVYYLFYERLQPLFGRAAGLLGGKWESEIYVTESKELKNFSKPRSVLGYTMPCEKVGKNGHSLSNPFLIEENGVFRLYYSAGLTYIPDCKFTEPTYICCAESNSPSDGYVKREQPVISPDPDSRFFNLCCGCLKVYRLSDCWVGLQNGLYTDGKDSKSAIQLLRSDDGIEFKFVKTLLEPQMCGASDWMAQFVYASHLVRTGGELRLYFNARNTAFILSGREHIGFARAKID